MPQFNAWTLTRLAPPTQTSKACLERPEKVMVAEAVAQISDFRQILLTQLWEDRESRTILSKEDWISESITIFQNDIFKGCFASNKRTRFCTAIFVGHTTGPASSLNSAISCSAAQSASNAPRHLFRGHWHSRVLIKAKVGDHGAQEHPNAEEGEGLPAQDAEKVRIAAAIAGLQP
eukprot:scaffold48_cov311-Pinguiococcus_pyrenoidosus.AAC.225